MKSKKQNKLAFLLILSVAIVYVCNLMIDNPYTHRFVNFYINEKILNQLPIGVRYESMKVQLLPPSVNLFSVKVWNKKSDLSETETLVETSQVSLSVSPWSLFLAKPQIGDLELHDLKGYWPPPKELLDALSQLGDPKEKSKSDVVPWPPSQSPPLSSVRIHNANLVISLPGLSVSVNQDPAEVTTFALEGADLNLDFRSWKDLNLEMSANSLNMFDRGSSYLEDAKVKLIGRMRGSEFKSRVFEVDSKRLSSQGDLNVKFNTQRRGPGQILDSIGISIVQNSDVDFSTLGSFIDLKGCVGRLSAHSTISIEIPVSKKAEPKFLVKGNARSHGAVIDGFHLYDSESDFTIDLDGMTFDEVRIKSADKLFGKAKGKLNFNKKLDYEFTGKPEALPFDMLLGVFNVPFDVINFFLTSDNLVLKGQGDPFFMKVTADGRLNNFSIPMVQYSHDKFPKSPECQIHFNLDINSKGIVYEGTQGQCGDAGSLIQKSFPLTFSGMTSFNETKGMKLEIHSQQFQNFSALSYFSQIFVNGFGSLRTLIHGPYNKIEVDSVLDAKELKIGEMDFQDFYAKINVNSSAVSWSELNAKTQSGGALSSKGAIALNDDLTLSADINARSLDHRLMGGLFKSFGEGNSDLEMVVEKIQAKLVGPLMKPFQYLGDIDFDVNSVRDGKHRYISRSYGHLESSPSNYILSNSGLELGSLSANLKGKVTRKPAANSGDGIFSLGLNPTDQIELNVNIEKGSKSQDQLEFIPFIDVLAAKSGIKGTLSGESKLSGNFQKISGVSKIRVENFKILSSQAPSMSLVLTNNGSNLEVLADQGGDSLKGRLKMDFSEAGIPFSWYLALKNYELRPFLPGFFSSDPRNFSYVTGTWSLDGKFENWWQSDGVLDIKQVNAKYFPPREQSRLPIQINSGSSMRIIMKKGQWNSDAGGKLSLLSDYGTVQFGFSQAKLPENIGLVIEGKILMEILRFAYPKMEVASGQVQFTGGIFGEVTDPKIDILFKDSKISSQTASVWQPVSLGTADFRPPVKDIQFQARLTENGVQIESFSGVKGTGKVSAEGYIAFNSKVEDPTDVSLFLEDASFLYPFPIVKNFDSVLSGNIRISGSEYPLQAAGRVTIKRARSNRDIDIRAAILESLRSSTGSLGPSSLQPLLSFDVNINADESISFNSRTVQATLSSQLRLSGTDISPEITGLVEVKKGKFLYKRDFFFKRGLINFDDPIKPDPSLDIAAESEVGGYRVSISISGKASEPVIDFTVEPPTRSDGTAISKLDIITLLSRGSLPEQKIGGIGSAESTAAAEALNLLAGQVEDTVQRVFDLSGQNIIRQVYIDTYADSNGTPIARFNLPLSLTDDLDLVLKVDQSTVKVSSEYSLHDSISLTGGIESSNEEANNGVKRQGNPADTGVDVKFKFAFP